MICSPLAYLYSTMCMAKEIMILYTHIFLNKSLCIFCSNTVIGKRTYFQCVHDFKWFFVKMVANILCYQIKMCVYTSHCRQQWTMFLIKGYCTMDNFFLVHRDLECLCIIWRNKSPFSLTKRLSLLSYVLARNKIN